MTTQHPTPDDLRTIAANLRSEGQTSRAEVFESAAHLIDVQNKTIKELESIAGDAVKLGMAQADEYDGFWQALGAKSADITIDDAVAMVKRLRAIESLAQFIVNNRRNFTIRDTDGVAGRTLDALAAALQEPK